MKNNKLRILTECAIMIAAAFVLSMIKVYQSPFGGSVTLFSLAPLILVSYRHGLGWGLGTSFVYSVLSLVTDLGNVAYVPTAKGIVLCILFDYIIAFTVIGLAGMFRNVKLFGNSQTNMTVTVAAGVLVSVVMRFLCHLLSGAVIWYELTKGWYPDDPTHIVHKFGPWMYSLVYNGTYMLPEMVLTMIAVPVIIRLLTYTGSRKAEK